MFNNALYVVHWYLRTLTIADFKSPSFVDNCCTYILLIWILIQQTFDSIDRQKNKMKNTKRYTNCNKTSVCYCFTVKNITFLDLRLNKSSDEKEVLWHPDWKLLQLYAYIAESSFFRYKQEPEKNHTMPIENKYNDYTISTQH